MNIDLIPAINESLAINLPATVSEKELRNELTEHISYLINHDFEKLVYHLYRIDVNEEKIRQLLEQKEGENAAGLIADLIIKRQLQKIKSRQQTGQRDKNISDEDKW